MWSFDEPIEEATSRKSLLVAWVWKYTVKIARMLGITDLVSTFPDIRCGFESGR